MKHLILTLWLLLTLIELLMSREVRIAWDQPDGMATSWRVWRGIELLATTTTQTATLQLTNAATTITVSAVNDFGESAMSAPLLIPPPMLWIQRSTNLVNWTNVIQIPHEPSQFIRIQLPPN